MTTVRISCKGFPTISVQDEDSDVWPADGSDDTAADVEVDGPTLRDYGSVGTPISGFPVDPKLTAPDGTEFEFQFWDVTDYSDSNPDGGANALFPSTDRKLVLGEQQALQVTATAWYAPVGVVGWGGSGPGVRTRTFDADLNAFHRETPIAWVDPDSAWAKGNHHGVSTATAVLVNAKEQLVHTVGKRFDRWLLQHSGNTLRLEEGATGQAVAIYRTPHYNRPPTYKNPNTIPWWEWQMMEHLRQGYLTKEDLQHLLNPPHPQFVLGAAARQPAEDILGALRAHVDSLAALHADLKDTLTRSRKG